MMPSGRFVGCLLIVGTLMTLLPMAGASPQAHHHMHRHRRGHQSSSAISGVVLSPANNNQTDNGLSLTSHHVRAAVVTDADNGIATHAVVSTVATGTLDVPVLIPNPHQRVHHDNGETDPTSVYPDAVIPSVADTYQVSSSPTAVISSSSSRLVNSKDGPIDRREAHGYTVKSSAPAAATSATPSTGSNANPPAMRFAAGSSIIVPSVVADNLHGCSSNDPTQQYVQTHPSPGLQLPSDALKVGVDGALSTAFALAADTGVVLVDETMQDLLANLDGQPHLSRDGGKGGYLDGQKLFLFCDTGSYTAVRADGTRGSFLGFVSSSVAIDKGQNGAKGQALTLEDGIGEWSDNAGRMRGFSPLTQGEQSYNLAMQGQGQRYAVWPESSLVPLNKTTALLYAPIIYDNVDMKTRKAVFTYTGTTLLAVTAHAEGGPRAERVVDKLFGQNEVEWGTIGGLRSYGPSGVGGNDGKVYLFGNTPDGLLLARSDADTLTRRDSYEYWTGWGWSPGMQRIDSTAHFVKGAYMDGDIFYSPAHLTFIFVYLNPYADNTFYFRYLKADHAIIPPFAPGGDPSSDYAENLVRYDWAEPQVLYKAAPGPTGMYIYAGGVHQGYFDEDDITNGGKKMLISWTAPTGANPASKSSEYSLMTAHIVFA